MSFIFTFILTINLIDSLKHFRGLQDFQDHSVRPADIIY